MTTILDCGYADLELLEDIKYDLDDIILELKKNNDLSFNNLLIDVFERGAMELKEEFNLQKDEIKQTISDLLQGKKDELISSADSELSDEQLEELLENDEGYQELLSDLNLINDNELNPEYDIDYYCNYIDTHVYIRHLGFYQKWLPEFLDSVEDNMGWPFEDRTY